jgi:hypothetical protein
MIILYLDFDGTVVTFDYPRIGTDVPHALRVLGRLIKKGVYIILNTQRAEMEDNSLTEAREYLIKNGINIDACNMKKVLPVWELPLGKKIYIDDIATGIPLMRDKNGIMMVDWLKVEKILEEYNIL